MLNLEEIKAVMPLLAMGAKKARRKLGDLEFTEKFGPALSSALVKIQRMADEGEKHEDRS